MPQPLSYLQIESAVGKALEKTGAIPAQVEALDALVEAGADVRRISTELANLIFNSKDPVKLKAILSAFQLHGVNINPESDQTRNVSINFNVVGDNTNLNNLFAPER